MYVASSVGSPPRRLSGDAELILQLADRTKVVGIRGVAEDPHRDRDVGGVEPVDRQPVFTGVVLQIGEHPSGLGSHEVVHIDAHRSGQ